MALVISPLKVECDYLFWGVEMKKSYANVGGDFEEVPLDSAFLRGWFHIMTPGEIFGISGIPASP